MGYFKHTVVPCFLLFAVVCIPVLFLHSYMKEGWLRLILSIVITVFLTGMISFKFLIGRELREMMLIKIKEKFVSRR